MELGWSMEKKIYEAIVVGGGVSGLSCARRLHDAERDFLLITKNLGGRMMASDCFCMNYGAAYMTTDYNHMLPYVEKREPLRIRDFFFFEGDNMSNLFTMKSVKHIPKMVEFVLILRKLRKHFLKYRAQAPYKSIQECFEEDPVLMKYWKMPAKDFIKEHGFEELNELYGNPVTAATAFTESDRVNAFYFIGMFFPVILKAWIVNFRYTVKKLTDGYEDRIKIGTVVEVKKNKDGTFNVHSSVSSFLARNIVFAAPHKALANVYPLPKPFIEQPAYVFYVTGTRKDIYQGKKAVVFRPRHHDIFMLWAQKNGADIIYSEYAEPDFYQYYENWRVVKRIHWDPGMVIPKDSFIKQRLEKNVYLASDYNLSLMEDSFLTGLYAANHIIGTK